MKKTFLLSLLLTLSLTAVAQKRWDAVTAKEVVNLVLEGGYGFGDVMARNGYTLVNYVTLSGDSFVTIYRRNCVTDNNGDVLRLGQGVSSVVICSNNTDQPSEIAVSLFSTTNANLFRQQCFDLGFKKSGTVRGNTVYKIPGYEFAIVESKGKSGRYAVTMFYFTQEYH
ncbi:MAG: hypothetical protein J6M53_01780 [Bacteroidaceae bacterium]|nr:hypothetical protein [Bacteroidaceae bacterium]